MHSCGSVGSYKALHKACPIPIKYGYNKTPGYSFFSPAAISAFISASVTAYLKRYNE